MNAPAITETVPIVTDVDGVIRIAGTRVTLDTLVDAFQEGATSTLAAGAARSFRERGASAPCFPERGKGSAISAGAETADSRPPLAGDPKAISVGAVS